MKKSISELKTKIRKFSAFCRPRPLGLDRAFRRYWVFQSIPGLLVEHSFEETQNWPCLDPCTPMPKPQLVNYMPNAKRRKRKKKVEEANSGAEGNETADDKENVEDKSTINSSVMETTEIEVEAASEEEHIFDRCTGDKSTCSVHGVLFGRFTRKNSSTPLSTHSAVEGCVKTNLKYHSPLRRIRF